MASITVLLVTRILFNLYKFFHFEQAIMKNSGKINRKLVLSINNSIPRALKELLVIRGDFKNIKEEYDGFKDTDTILKLMKKQKSNFLLAMIII